MFRFSTRGLALYIGFVGLTLALTRVGFVLGGAILGAAVMVAYFLVPIRVWRHVTFGGLAAILVASVGLNRYISVKYGYPNSYYHRSTWYPFFERTRPVVVQLGALVGGTVGLFISRWRGRQ